MYTYFASSTGLTGSFHLCSWRPALDEPHEGRKITKRLFEEIREELRNQPPEGILMVGFKNPEMDAIYRGKTIAEAAKMRNQPPEQTIVDMVLEDDGRIQCIYFSMSEENIRKKIQLPWVSYCSDAGPILTLTKILELIHAPSEALFAFW